MDTTHAIALYFGIGFVVWYAYVGTELYMNGASVGRSKWWVFEGFWEQLLWFSPGGLARRINYIKRITRDDGYFDGHSYDEIRDNNLYETIAKESLGSGYYFWGVNVLLSFFFWWLMLIALCVLILINLGYQLFKD